MIPERHDATRTDQGYQTEMTNQTPGILFVPSVRQEQPLMLRKTGVAGFMGLTVRGPERKAMEIHNPNEFIHVFGGSPDGGLLEPSIRAYFMNGGERCFVSRVIARDASPARYNLTDSSGKTIFGAEALERGAFGNNISLSIHNGEVSCALKTALNRKTVEFFDLQSARSGAAERLIRLFQVDLSNIPESLNIMMSGGRDAIDETEPGDFTGSNNESLQTEDSPLEALLRTEECDSFLAPDLFWLHSRAAKLGIGPFLNISSVLKVQMALVSAATRSGASIAILDAPPDCSLKEVIDWFVPLQSRHAAAYFPWVVSTSGMATPPSAYAAGLFARIENEIGPHRTPANIKLTDVAELTSLTNKGTAETLAKSGVNTIILHQGVRLWAAVTTDGTDLGSIRFINAVRKTLEPGLAWAAFEPNQPALWETIARRLSAFARELHKNGLLAGETPEQAWRVKCDFETNPPEEISAGRIHAEIDLAPVKPAKFVRISIGMDSAA